MEDSPPGMPAEEEPRPPSHDSRLSIPAMVRIPAVGVGGFVVGYSLGVAHGGQMAALRFRAEHAHRMPTDLTGWYLYHKSKNYHVIKGGLVEGFRAGCRIGAPPLALLGVEHLFDTYRGARDLFNSVLASLAVAGGISLLNNFAAAEAARTARQGLKFGLVYGGLQDLVAVARGQPVGYFDFLRRQLGGAAVRREEAT